MAARKRIDLNAAPLDVEQFPRATTPSSPPRIADRPPPEALDALRLREWAVSRSDGGGTPHEARQ
jgi:hypothetical protein